ncbi:MAG: TRAP transporter large permease subunit [Gammaproteobacteria bacterium]|nr:TRAP transporter large permease subunit [Gammaproteobacteria bacterium]MBU1443141.1 TRAP transporter large permease subunit [Gammaproteobacteria bacterium]MBU2288169.1 TRAP transporter large permease subunit [Gammaproteobacteria bacterium]MBU2409874.1 TRAP transporter large permease subunit [Gammaproteobacteria bacterium]
MSAFWIVLFLFVMLAGGVPVGFALLVSGAAGLISVGGVGMLSGILSTTPLSTVSSYELISVPMFILMAEFVILSGIADSLFKAAATWVGRTPGGLGIATALSGAGFGAISGSSTAAAATLSATSIPAMIRLGYDSRVACGVVAISGTLAMLIPPSIALILFGIVADVSVGKLLIGGVIPGVLVTLTIALTVLYIAWRHPSHAPRGPAYTMAQKFASLKGVWPMLVLLGAVTGVIYTGIATPTEASAIGAVGALVITAVVGRLTWQQLMLACIRALRSTVMIFMILLGAHVFGYFFTLTGITQQLVQSVGSLNIPAWTVMAIILGIILLLGCFLDQIAILVLMVPVVLPIVTHLGYDPVWFGVVMIVVGEVGMVTPPVGLNAFVVARYAKRPLSEVFVGVWPHVVAHIVLIAILLALPQIVMWLPSRMP